MTEARASGRRGRRARLVALVCIALVAPASAEDRRDLLRVRAAPGGALWSVGARGVVRTIAARGTPGTLVATPAGDGWSDVCFATPDVGWIAGLDGRILETRDGGETWELRTTEGERHLFALACGPGPFAVVVGDWGTIRVSDGEGAWEDRTIGEDVVLYGAAVSARAVVVVGEGGAILRSADRGKAFARVDSPVDRSLFDVAIAASGRGVAVGLEGVIVVTEDGGLRWREVKSPVRESLYGVALDGAQGFAVGELGTVLSTADGGASWARVEAPAGRMLEFLHGVEIRDGRGVAVGAGGAIVWLR
jgi:photosystem II stability/assembly factor-like uncharacterized protein